MLVHTFFFFECEIAIGKGHKGGTNLNMLIRQHSNAYSSQRPETID